MQTMDKPSLENSYQGEHAERLIFSYHHWTGKDLVKQAKSCQERYRALFKASYGVVSHNTENNPIFNYGNLSALDVFEMNWTAFTQLASRKSAEQVNQVERERLMAQVCQRGFIDDYQGVRISSTNKRFLIGAATIWNVVDESGKYYGQAAVFFKCTEL